MEQQFVPADVVSVTGRLSVLPWGSGTPIRMNLHSGHPLLADDRVWLAEIQPGIWMSMGPISSEVDYFPDLDEREPLEEPPPLTITSGTVDTPDGDFVDTNPPNSRRCPYSGSIPTPEETKVLIFTDEEDNCVELPDNTDVAPPPPPPGKLGASTPLPPLFP